MILRLPVSANPPGAEKPAMAPGWLPGAGPPAQAVAAGFLSDGPDPAGRVPES